jgi:hypothetical protein
MDSVYHPLQEVSYRWIGFGKGFSAKHLLCSVVIHAILMPVLAIIVSPRSYVAFLKHELFSEAKSGRTFHKSPEWLP